jgi:uncharacterized protein YjbJ (UPF0337 family)
MGNMHILQGKLEEVRGMLIKRWGQLTDNDLTEFRGDTDQLIGLIHRKTGEGYEAVEKYLDELGISAASAVGAAAETVREYAGHAAKTVQRTAREAVNQAHAGCLEAKRLVHDQPVKTVTIFFGTGLLVGLIMAARHHCSK